jgi:LPXTG-motif cell wall-anchored protein
MVFTVYSVGAEAIVDVDMYFAITPDDDTAIVCDPPAIPDEPLAGGQVLVEFTGPFEAGTSISCRFTVRALSPGEEADINVVYMAFGTTSGIEAPGDVMPSWSLIASVPDDTTTTTSTTSPTTVVPPDPAGELPETGTNSTIPAWAVALIAAGALLLIAARRRAASDHR